MEYLLKARIARDFRAEDSPDRRDVRDIFVHDLNRLLNLSKLKAALDAEAAAALVENWRIVSDWTENSRYRLLEEARARNMLDAVADPAQGVFQWIRSKREAAPKVSCGSVGP